MKPLLLLPALLLLSACATTQPGSQTTALRAEQVLAISFASVDRFLAFEASRRAELPASVRDVAQRIRREAPQAFQSANIIRLAYKSNRTAQREADLFTALSVVDAMVSELRVWAPRTTASAPGRGNPVPNTFFLVMEAQSSQSNVTGNWVALVPVFVELAKEIYVVVNRAREASAQSAEWTTDQEVEFAQKLSTAFASPHWKL